MSTSTRTRPPDTRSATPPDVDQLPIPIPRSARDWPEPTPAAPRVWLVAGGGRPDPTDLPTVRDHWLRKWWPGKDGLWHTGDGHHYATWAELRNRFDLVEVLGA